jgi:hypothetical protein
LPGDATCAQASEVRAPLSPNELLILPPEQSAGELWERASLSPWAKKTPDAFSVYQPKGSALCLKNLID